MIEYDRNKQAGLAEEKQALKICVAGVGGAGSNVIDRITLDRSVDADLACFHTDVRVLNHGMAPTKVQLGGDLMKGVGAGGDPDLGREAALFSREQIRQALAGHEIVFICTGLGGGTGSGAAPVIAEIAKSSGALVVVLATMPFSFEGRRRLNQAEEALELLQKRADALVLFDNNRMGELVLPKEGIQKAFTLADQTLAQCARAVSVMVGTPGLVKLGLDDLVSALNASNGRCLFGFGEARGQNRGADALKKALKSPLIDQGSLLQQTKNLLAHIVGGESLTLMEVDAIMKQLGRNVPEQTQILFGLAVDPKLGDAISVTLISSLGLEQLAATSKPVAIERPAPAAPPKPAPVESKPAARQQQRPATPPPLPVEEPAPEAAQQEEEEPMELFSPASTPATPPPSANHEEEPPQIEPKQEVVAVVKQAPAAAHQEEEAEIEEEETEASPFAFSEPVVKEKAPAPVVVARVQETERKSKPVARGVLAAVLSSPANVSHGAAPADEVIEEEPEQLFAGATASAPSATAVATAAVKAPSSNSQQTFRLGDEDRGRFKDTEPSLSDGEDLDVPTWMRHRKKARA